ncbi:phosphoglycerate mutase-like protein [Auricularia subglabra TFB-10046 SS5]|nr:phosphoglycerate mutase-like protein [Auricularia subglabra TFB-10046 SS5]
MASDAEIVNIHLIRHGEALHNVDRTYADVDPPLTEAGLEAATALGDRLQKLGFTPSAIVTSPMTRTIQTAFALFPDGLRAGGLPLHIWPELREAHDAACNKGRPRAEMQRAYPHLDFSLCAEVWSYEPHSFQAAVQRAESVRRRFLALPGPDVVVVGHRGFLAFLVETITQFENLEMRTYRIASDDTRSRYAPKRY